MDDLRFENEELKVRVRMMAAMLEKLEWAKFGMCFFCRRMKIFGHKPNCMYDIVMTMPPDEIGEKG